MPDLEKKVVEVDDTNETTDLDNDDDFSNDDDTFVDEAEDVNDEEPSDEDDSEDDETETDDTDDDTEDSDEDGEFFDDDKDYLKQFGLDEDFENIEAVIEKYKLLKQVAPTNVAPKPEEAKPASTDKETTQTEGLQLLKTSPFTKVIDEWKEKGMLKEDGSESTYRAIAELGDAAIMPMMEDVRKVLQAVVTQAMSNQKSMQALNWQSLDHPLKGNLKSSDVFGAMEAHGFESMEKAIAFLSLMDSNLVTKANEASEERGRKKGIRKRKRANTLKRSKGNTQSQSRYDFKKYRLPDDSDWDESKLDGLKNYGLDMIDAYDKIQQRKR